MATAAPILDLYAPLSHKAPLQDHGGRGHLAPSWVPEDAQRRLTAYKILAAYALNVAREYLPVNVPEAAKDKRREYGDADLLVDRIRAGVLGDEPEIVVEGADVDLPDEPELPPEPEDPGDGASDVLRRVFALRQRRWTEEAGRIVDDWEQAWVELPGLVERQDWLRDWAESESFWGKVHEGEGDCIELGDGVYTLAWSTVKQRPVMRVYDPGFYFPVRDERSDDEGFPRKVHVAWQFEGKDHKPFVRRLTWELVEVEPHSLPYTTEASTETCLFSDGTWDLNSEGMRNGLYDLSEGAATWAETEDGVPARRVDLGVDFLPVLHIPNTPASREHFGRSALLVIAQLLDDIAMSDTDLQAAAALAAGPAIALSGGNTQDETKVAPGTIYGLREGGRMDVLDLSAGMVELRALNEDLRDLLSINGRVPNAVLGRVDLTGNLAGVTLALSFSPFSQLIGAFRTTRGEKYQLLLKMVQRIAQVGQALPPGENPRAQIAFGSFLPSDKTAVVDQVTRLLEAGAISMQTAVQLLVAAGYSIDDARGEVQRIRYENPAAAKDLADATGSEAAAAEYLGIEVPEPAQAPVVEPQQPQTPPQPELPEETT